MNTMLQLLRSRRRLLSALLAIGLVGLLVGSVALAQVSSPVISVAKITAGYSSGTPAQVTVTLSPASTNTVTVQYATRDGTAVAGQDYQTTTGTLVFAPGDTSQVVSVPVLSTAASGVDLWLDLSNAVNASIDLSRSSVEVPINPSGTATVSFEFSGWTYDRASGSAIVTVRLDGVPSSTASVLCSTGSGGTAVANVDYTPTSQTLVWQPSEAGTAKTFAITLIDNSTIGPTLTVNLTLSAPSNVALGTQATATLNILPACACYGASNCPHGD